MRISMPMQLFTKYGTSAARKYISCQKQLELANFDISPYTSTPVLSFTIFAPSSNLNSSLSPILGILSYAQNLLLCG